MYSFRELRGSAIRAENPWHSKYDLQATAPFRHSSHAQRKLPTATLEGKNMSIWTILFAILLIAWISGFTVFHVAGGLIHLLLVLAVISLVLHFVLGKRTA